MVHAMLLALMLGGASPAQPPAAGDVNRRWTLTLGIGWSSSGVMRSMESAMREAGFDQTENIPIGEGAVTNPSSSTGGIPWIVGVHRALAPYLSAGLVGFGAQPGDTSGFRQGHPLGFPILLHVNVLGFAPVFSVQGEDPFGIVSPRLGVGPALYVARVSASSSREPVGFQRSLRLGFVVDAELRAPARSRIFAALQIQYRHVGDFDVGPYTVTAPFGGQAVFPTSKIALSHWHLGGGVGVRL